MLAKAVDDGESPAEVAAGAARSVPIGQRLAELAELHRSGPLTGQEWATERSQIIVDI